jgi:RNA polymerase sigma-70 factor (ECF subfamily)
LKTIPLPSETLLIDRARAGDQNAFRQLVQRHQLGVRTTVLGMLGDVAEVDDVAQEVFIRLHRALPDFKGTASLSTYLHRIAINLSLNELAKRKRRRGWLQWIKPGLNDEADPSSHAGDMGLRDDLYRALQRLEPAFRTVVVLRLVRGYSLKETAELLDLPSGTVASRLARAQKKLRTWLRDYG